MDTLFDPTLWVQMTCTDPDEFLEKAAGWDIEHLQLGSGNYQISMDIRHTENVQISNISHHVGVLERGSIPLEACAISLPTLLSSKPLYYRGGVLEKNQCPALLPGEEFETFSSGGVNYVTLVINIALLDREALLLTGHPFSTLVQHQQVCITQQDQQRLRYSITTFMHSLKIHQYTTGVDRQESLLEKQFVEQLILSIQPPSGEGPSLPNRRIVARQAEQTIQQHLQQQLSIEQICSLVGCSMRTLHLGFKECYGTTPSQYARTLALNAVHRQLCSLAPNETITDIAMRWGFYHLGRFSSQYKSLFNELPSVTVRRYRETPPDFSGLIATAV